jgi:hypothetical protein
MSLNAVNFLSKYTKLISRSVFLRPFASTIELYYNVTKGTE